MSFSLLFFTGRINLLYARTLINSSYRRFASGLAIVTIYINEKERENKLNTHHQRSTNKYKILMV